MTDHAALIAHLRQIVGRRYVRQGDGATAQFRKGFRFGGGPCLAAVLPGSLVEQWRIVQACAAAGVAIIMQAANTGLTGGSTPQGDDYGRDVVVINTRRLRQLFVIQGGRQIVCLPGATLDQLEKRLKPLGREPHSVIGSSCIGASVVGGICNNSGGSLVRRGPAYTELALYGRVEVDGSVTLVNRLGIDLGDDPEESLARLDRGAFKDCEVQDSATLAASDPDYGDHVRDIDAPTPARFNADPPRLFDASGCAGKLLVFAVRLDTFASQTSTRVFYIGTNDTSDLTRIRRTMLRECSQLPISGEYLHRTAFDIAARYGKDVFLAIRHLGTKRLPLFFALKSRVDAIARVVPLIPANITDRLLLWLSDRAPPHLPPRMTDFRDRFAHHLLLKVSEDMVGETREILTQTLDPATSDLFECSDTEAELAFLHRFAAAGAAVRYRSVHDAEVEDIVALDIALPRNESDWFERLPPEIEAQIVHSLYYGHFFCHVFHQDYLVRKGVDPVALEHRLWALLDTRGAEYPAEHNVGHLYRAKPSLLDFYRTLDPSNMLNPGIGQSSKQPHWANASPHHQQQE